MKRSVVLSIAVPLCLSVLAPLTAGAQEQSNEAGASASGGLQEIVVTARYREESLQQTPIAITALTGADIQDRAFTSSADIGYTVPNASLRPAQALFGNTMTAFIRGIGQYDFLPEFEPGVGIYIDDILYPIMSGSVMDLMDLDHVEVLRGPQGTLFGRGAIGGAIRYISKMPKGDDSGEISVTYGQFNRVDVRGTYDFKLMDNLFARISGMSKRSDGYQTVYDFACLYPSQAGTLPVSATLRNGGCKVGTQGGEDASGLRASLRFLATENLEATLTADYVDDSPGVRADTLLDVLPSGPYELWNQHYVQPAYGVQYDTRFVPDSRYVSYATYKNLRNGIAYDPHNYSNQRGISGKVDYKINDAVRATLIGSYRKVESGFAQDMDGSPIDETTTTEQMSLLARTAELRFSGRLLERVDWTVGGFYYKGEINNAQTSTLPAVIFSSVYGAIVGNPPSTDPAVVAAAEAAGANLIDNVVRTLVNVQSLTAAENRSAFAHVVFDLTDKLSLTAGMRYSKDIKNEEFDNSLVAAALDTGENHFDWKAGIDYKFTDALLGYASASTGYRPQAFNPRPFQRTQFVKVPGEEATSYEVGMKSDLLEHRLRANVAAFYIDYSKRITIAGGTECLLSPADPGVGPPVYLGVPPGTPGSVTDSVGNICLATNLTSRTLYVNTPGKIKGAELELTYRPIDALTLNGSYGYTDFSADDLDNPIIAVRQPIYVPKQNWTLGAAYAIGLASGATLSPRVDLYSQSKICSSVLSTRGCADGYELLNARLEWASRNDAWTAAVGAANLTNRAYFYNKWDATEFGQPVVAGQPGPPREWYVTLTRKFH